MTIYATVNNLAGISRNDSGSGIVWTIVSASSLLQGGNPYFVPDFAESFEARPALALKIGKLGKGIARRFASRYVCGAAPAILMVASDLLENLREAGLPWSQAVSYDRSTVIGQFSDNTDLNGPNLEISLRLRSDKELIESDYRPQDQNLMMERVIECISRDNTLKTGDIILAGISAEGPKVYPGMKATLALGGNPPYRFNIR